MLYGNEGLMLTVEDGDSLRIAGDSEIELHVVKKEIEKISRNFPVLYAGSDINKIARAEEVSYKDELNKFERVFVDDKGKAYYILK